MFYILAFIVTMMIAVPWIVIMAIPIMVLFGSPFTVVLSKSKSVESIPVENSRVSFLVLEDGKFPAVPLINVLVDNHFINAKKVDLSLLNDKLPASEIVDILKDETELKDLVEKIPILYYKESEAKYGELEVKR